MDNKLYILIIEDDNDTCARLEKCIDANESMYIAGITGSSTEGLKCITNCRPNVVILDLELMYGEGDGISFLRDLKALNPSVFPFIIVTTNNPSTSIHELTRSLGVDYIMYKHQKGYSEQSVIDFLDITKDFIVNNHKPDECAEVPEVEHKKKLSLAVKNELNRLGVSPKLIGYTYLYEGILILLEDNTSNVFNILSGKYNKSIQSIQRSMQTAINKTWAVSSISTLEKYYTNRIRPDKGAPTVMEFIHYYRNQLYDNI